MTNFEAVKILVTNAGGCIPPEKEDYAEALMRAVWALSMEEVKRCAIK